MGVPGNGVCIQGGGKHGQAVELHLGVGQHRADVGLEHVVLIPVKRKVGRGCGEGRVINTALMLD